MMMHVSGVLDSEMSVTNLASTWVIKCGIPLRQGLETI